MVFIGKTKGLYIFLLVCLFPHSTQLPVLSRSLGNLSATYLSAIQIKNQKHWATAVLG